MAAALRVLTASRIARSVAAAEIETVVERASGGDADA